MFVLSDCSVQSPRIVLVDMSRVVTAGSEHSREPFFVVSAEMFIFGPRLKSPYADKQSERGPRPGGEGRLRQDFASRSQNIDFSVFSWRLYFYGRLVFHRDRVWLSVDGSCSGIAAPALRTCLPAGPYAGRFRRSGTLYGQ